jgi:hypothetical protein
MSLFRTKETKVMIIIFGLFIQQLTNPGSNGLISLILLQESVQAFVYSDLGAQAKTRWPIVGRGASPEETQKAFRGIADDTSVQSGVSTNSSNMRKAIRDTNVVVNTALNRDVILFPSNMLLLEKPIPGYSNILLHPDNKTTFGVNKKVNYVGVQQVDTPKKQHQDSAPTAHLNTLSGTHKTPGKVVPTVSKYTKPHVRCQPAYHTRITKQRSPEVTPSMVAAGTAIAVGALTKLVMM